MEKPILALEGVSKFYTSGQNVVVGLNSVRLSFSRGEFVAITGESGSGKSTLAHVLSGIFPYEGGEMYFDGRPTSHYDGRDWERYRRDNISFISQNYGILLSCTVLENVVSALCLSGMDKQEARQEAKKILEKVELWELRKRRAAKLSSGQKQRLSIARALAKPAPILIADEPTGNLDPENSAKVISLLAEAAKERLVLLITHDFAEAEGCATRRVSLQDGRITMDAALLPAASPEPVKTVKTKKKQALSLYAARLQLTGKPVWGALVLLFFALTAFAVFAFLGNFIIAIDDTNTRVYDKSAFPNGNPTRVVVQRIDGENMTQADYDTLLNTRYVERLERSGFLSDINVYYINGEHYRGTYYLENIGTSVDPVYVQREKIELLDNSYFARTVPLMAGDDFLTAGRLPENIHEVVITGDESRIGEELQVYLADKKDWAIATHIHIDVTVVGVTDQEGGIFLHETVGRSFSNPRWSGFLYIPDQTVEEGTCQLSEQLFFSGDEPKFITLVENQGEVRLDLNLGDRHDMPYPMAVRVSFADYEKLVPAEMGNQVSLTISNYSYTDRVLEAVRSAGYIAVSPYRMGATNQVESLALERQQTLIICAAVLVVVLSLQIIVLRALFSGQTENYRLLANLGLTCGTAKRSTLWQILLFTALGQAIASAALWYCNSRGVERIVNIIRHLPTKYMLLLSAVHLAAALVATFWLGRALQKRVYPMFVNRDDLSIDEDEEGKV